MRQAVVDLGKRAAEHRYELETCKLRQDVAALKEKRAFYKAYIRQQQQKKEK
jgi:hypothetical protein